MRDNTFDIEEMKYEHAYIFSRIQKDLSNHARNLILNIIEQQALSIKLKKTSNAYT